MEGCQNPKKQEKGVNSVKIPLENLICEGSYDGLAKELPTVQGILEVDIDKNLKQAFIDYDEGKITPTEIRNKISEFGCRIV